MNFIRRSLELSLI
jgi:hypothetical protein